MGVGTVQEKKAFKCPKEGGVKKRVVGNRAGSQLLRTWKVKAKSAATLLLGQKEKKAHRRHKGRFAKKKKPGGVEGSRKKKTNTCKNARSGMARPQGGGR